MRKLASIQRIFKIEAIEGADKIELAYVLGWKCVVNKGQFKPMDLAVYFEIDSFLPISPEFEFLRKSSYRKTDIMGEGFRLNTMKFRGQISQGLLLPISAFSNIPKDIELGTDVTKLLNVRKWEIEERVTTGGTVIGELPIDVPHTDETRIQAEPELLNDFSGLEYYISTKIDGSSHSVSIDENGFYVTGHNYEYKDDGKCAFYELVKRDNIKEKLEKYYKENNLRVLTIQGEFAGPGIQSNRLNLKRPAWYVFTIRLDGKRVGLTKMQEICRKLDIEMVPIEEVGEDLPSKYATVEDLLKRADGNYKNAGKKEGIVIRPTTPIYSERIGAELSMKIVSNKYLLKNKE